MYTLDYQLTSPWPKHLTTDNQAKALYHGTANWLAHGNDDGCFLIKDCGCKCAFIYKKGLAAAQRDYHVYAKHLS